MATMDLREGRDFRIKDAVLLCLFLTGMRVPAESVLYLFHVNLEILYNLAFLGMVLVIVRQFGKKELAVIMKGRKVPAAVSGG